MIENKIRRCFFHRSITTSVRRVWRCWRLGQFRSVKCVCFLFEN